MLEKMLSRIETYEILKKIDTDELIVFDTNVILNFYFVQDLKYLNKYLEYYKKNIWIPYHVFEEFNKKRTKKINGTRQIINSLLEFKTKQETNKSLKKFKDMPTDIGEEILVKIDKYLEGITEYIKYKKPTLLALDNQFGAFNYKDNDEYYKVIENNIFFNLGENYTQDELKKIENNAKDRFAKKIPPGYKDNSKNSNQFGDYIIWSQVMKKAKNDCKNIIFITDDKKEDWRKDGEWRKELIDEFKSKTDQTIKLMDFKEFIKYTTNNKYSDLDSLLFEISHGIYNEPITNYKYNEKFFYMDCIEKIFNERRLDVWYDDKSKECFELLEFRKKIESKMKNIYCGGIYRIRFEFSMDIYIRENSLMHILCTLHYHLGDNVNICVETSNEEGKFKQINLVNDGDCSKSYVEDMINIIIYMANKFVF